MSVTVDPLVEWCTKARAILGQKKKDGPDLIKLVKGAEGVFKAGKPDEVTGAEWDALDYYLGVARDEMPTQAAIQKLESQKALGRPQLVPINLQVNADLVTQVVEEMARNKAKRIAALGKLRGEKDVDKLLDAAGKKELAQKDEPDKEFAAAEVLRDRNAALAARIPALNKLDVPPALLTASTAATTLIAALKLEEACDALDDLEDRIKALELEKSELNDLFNRTPEGAKVAVADYRKLNKLEKQLRQIEADFDNLLAKARAAGAGSASKLQQCNDLEPVMRDAIKKWPGLDTAVKLANHGPGSVSKITENLASIGQVPPKSAAEIAKEKLEKEWADFLADVAAKWKVYADSGFDPALRGPGPKSGLTLDAIRTRCSQRKSVKIGGRTYTHSESVSAGHSMKTPLKPPFQANMNGELIMSFIYHLAPV